MAEQPPLPPGPEDNKNNDDAEPAPPADADSNAAADEENENDEDAFFSGIENDSSIRTTKEERKRFAELRKAGQFSYVRGHDQVFVPGSPSPATPGGIGGSPLTPQPGARYSGATSTPAAIPFNQGSPAASGSAGLLRHHHHAAAGGLTPSGGSSLNVVQSPAGGPRVYTTPGYTPQVSIQQKTFETDPTTLDKRPWEEDDENRGQAPSTAASAAAAAAAVGAGEEEEEVEVERGEPSDYFNYGFDPESWNSYRLNQILVHERIKRMGRRAAFELAPGNIAHFNEQLDEPGRTGLVHSTSRGGGPPTSHVKHERDAGAPPDRKRPWGHRDESQFHPRPPSQNFNVPTGMPPPQFSGNATPSFAPGPGSNHTFRKRDRGADRPAGQGDSGEAPVNGYDSRSRRGGHHAHRSRSPSEPNAKKTRVVKEEPVEQTGHRGGGQESGASVTSSRDHRDTGDRRDRRSSHDRHHSRDRDRGRGRDRERDRERDSRDRSRTREPSRDRARDRDRDRGRDRSRRDSSSSRSRR
eukprot:INCI17506.1.p1 GENE.INCI17506.1~~INCI17506.1.p1  ORF type:complete len:525 (-),score=60.72 INCI17506.1:93-1667(-)